MKRLFSFVVAFAFVFTFVGAAMAYNNQLHVTEAYDGKGDVLVFPAYFVDKGSLETKFTIVNTSQNESSVAKVIIRSFKDSVELIDFLVYLSPRDEWQGTLKYSAEKDDLVIYSEDDSVLRIIGETEAKWASKENPLNMTVPAQGVSVGLAADDSKWMGYVEVINGWASGDTFSVYNDQGNIIPIDLSTHVEKKYIKTAYENSADPEVWLTARTGDNQLPPNGDANYQGSVYNGFRYFDANCNVPFTKDILSGWSELKIANFGTAKLQATTFEDFGIRSDQNLRIEDMTALWTVDSLNSMGELEAAFSKNNLVLPYSNNDEAISLHMITYPTKGTAAGLWSPFFNVWGSPLTFPGWHQWDGKFMPRLHIFDLMENYQTLESVFSPLDPDNPTELFFLLTQDNPATAQIEFPFEEGWVEYRYIDALIGTVTQSWLDAISGATTQPGNNPARPCLNIAPKWVLYAGAPAIATTVTVDQNGLNWFYGSSDKGVAADPLFSTTDAEQTIDEKTAIDLFDEGFEYVVDEANEVMRIVPTSGDAADQIDFNGDGNVTVPEVLDLY
jgi:hypothetical protein